LQAFGYVVYLSSGAVEWLERWEYGQLNLCEEISADKWVAGWEEDWKYELSKRWKRILQQF